MGSAHPRMGRILRAGRGTWARAWCTVPGSGRCRLSSCGPNKTSCTAKCSIRSGIRIADSRSEKAMTESARSKDSYISLRYQLEDSEKATKLLESPSPESVVAASGEGPDL